MHELAIVAWAIGCVVVAALFSDGSATSTSNKEGYSNHAYSDQNSAEQYSGYRAQRPVEPPSAEVEAPIADPKPDRKEWREEQDLKAQQEMSRWAWWMIIVTAIGSVIAAVAAAATAVGVYYIARTLHATQSLIEQAEITSQAAVDAADASNAAARQASIMNEITRRSSEQQLRAYLEIRTVEIIHHPLRESIWKGVPFKVEGRFQVFNSGVTPAYRVKAFLKFVYSSDLLTEDAWARSETQHDLGTVNPNSYRWQKFELSLQFGSPRKQLMKISQRKIGVICNSEVIYYDVFSADTAKAVAHGNRARFVADQPEGRLMVDESPNK